MNEMGHLFLDYFQHHLEEAKIIGARFASDLAWAVRAINLFYVYKLWSRLVQSDDWADLWETACWGRTNIEAFNAMFNDFAPELDAGGIVEYMEERKGSERLARNLIPKNVPQTQWWWFADFEI